MPAATSLGAGRFARLQALFDAVVALPPDRQDDFIGAECAGDEALRSELEKLLAHERLLARTSTEAAFGSLDQALRDALPDAVHKGSRLGVFTVIEEIGVGGMGRVFRAERIAADFRQTVAIKLLRQELINPDLLKRFSIERKMLALLNHPGIARLIDAGALGDGTPFVVMELVAGTSLLEHCDLGRQSLAERLQLFRRVLAAVSHAHQHLIVHRDLKSSNILVDADGQPKLLDFGIAKAIDGSELAAVTATRDRYLSLGNAAPEQLLGEPITVACDVYSLGVILYELLCGLAPFDLHQQSAAALETEILKVPPMPMIRRAVVAASEVPGQRALVSLAALQKSLAGDLERIVQKCLRKAPGERYASVEQLDEDIGNFLEHRPIRATEGQRWYRLRKFVARNRLPTALSTVLLMAIIAIVGIVAARNATAIRERDRAQQALAILRKAFLSADPARVAGEEVTVRAVLDSARPVLEESFETQPELYASLAGTIAEVELSLGLSTQSAQLFDRAVDAARRSNLDAKTRFDLLVLRARVLNSAGEFERAKQSLQEARGLDVVLTPEWEVTQAIVLLKEGDINDVIVLLRRAIERMGDRGAEDEWANSARLRLAEALSHNEQLDDALASLVETIAWQKKTLPPKHPRITMTRLQLVIQKRVMGKLDESLVDARQVHADVVAAYGEGSPFAAKAAMVLGNSLASMDRNAEAAIVYREVVLTFRRILGDTHPNTLRAAYNLAAMLASEPAHRGEAIALYQSTVVAAEQRLGMDSESTVLFRHGYATALIADGQAKLALSVLTAEGAMLGIGKVHAGDQDMTLQVLREAFEAVGCKTGQTRKVMHPASVVESRCGIAGAALGQSSAH